MHMEQVYKQGGKYSSSGMYKTRYYNKCSLL